MFADRNGSRIDGEVFEVCKMKRIAEEYFILSGDGGEVFGVAANRDDYFGISFEIYHLLGKECFINDFVVKINVSYHIWVIQNNLASHFGIAINKKLQMVFTISAGCSFIHFAIKLEDYPDIYIYIYIYLFIYLFIFEPSRRGPLAATSTSASGVRQRAFKYRCILDPLHRIRLSSDRPVHHHA